MSGNRKMPINMEQLLISLEQTVEPETYRKMEKSFLKFYNKTMKTNTQILIKKEQKSLRDAQKKKERELRNANRAEMKELRDAQKIRTSRKRTSKMPKKHTATKPIVPKVQRSNKYSKKRAKFKENVQKVVLVLVIATAVAATVNYKKDAEAQLPQETVVETSAEAVTEYTDTEIEEQVDQQQDEKNDEKSTVTDYAEFNFTYDDRCESTKIINTKEKYGDLIQKYSEMYGLDGNLMTALATHESGEHNPNINEGGAVGLMQIQASVWKDKTIKVYNYKTNSYETTKIDLNDISNVEKNIEVGCKIFASTMKELDYNVLAAIQGYNYGTPYMRTVIREYAKANGKTTDGVINNASDTGWTKYRSVIKNGDDKYLEHVFSYLNSEETELKFKTPNSQELVLKVNNTNQAKSKTR